MSSRGDGGVARELYEALAGGNFEEAAVYVTDRVLAMNVATGDVYRGRDGFLEFARGWSVAFPDRRFEVLKVSSGGTLGEARGLSAYQNVLAGLFIAFPDLEMQVLDTIAEGDRVVIRFTMSGTHLGEFRGIPPTRKRIVGEGTNTYRLEDSRIVEEWWQGDVLALLQQMDAAPATLRPLQSGPSRGCRNPSTRTREAHGGTFRIPRADVRWRRHP